MVGEVRGGAHWWEVWGSIPCPGTHSTSWFSQKLCCSDRTTVCPVGPGARGPKSMPTGDGGLGIWGWSQGGRRLESQGGVGVGIGSERGGNQGGRGVQVAECGRARRGEPPFSWWQARSQVLERLLLGLGGDRRGAASLPELRSPAHCRCFSGRCVPGSSLWAARRPHGVLSLSSCSLPPVGLPATSLACDLFALVSAYWSHLLLLL